MATRTEGDLADFCQWWPVGSRRACYAPASLVLVRLSGATLDFTCTEHAAAWAAGIHGTYLLLKRDEWEARGAGFRGAELGG